MVAEFIAGAYIYFHKYAGIYICTTHMILFPINCKFANFYHPMPLNKNISWLCDIFFSFEYFFNVCK